MEDVFEALRAEVQDNLKPLSEFLFERGIPHRIYEESGHQVLVVSKKSDANLVNEFYKAWKLDELDLSGHSSTRKVMSLDQFHALRIRNPTCLFLIFLSCAGFTIGYWLPSYQLVAQFTFLPFIFENGRIQFGPMNDQYWRFVTPTFLHFGWLHLVFNCLWIWELGLKPLL